MSGAKADRAKLRRVIEALEPGAMLTPVVTCRGVSTDAACFARLSVAEAFARHAGADVLASADDARALAAASGARLRDDETWEDLFFHLLLERVDRVSDAPIPRSGRTGRPRRPRLPAAIRPIRGSPNASSCSSAASNSPMP